MHGCSAELFGGDVLPGRRLHERRSADEDRPGAADDDRLVRPRLAGRVRGPDLQHGAPPSALLARALVRGGVPVRLTLVSLGVSPLIAIWVYHAPTPGAFYARFVLYALVLTAWYPPLYAIMFEQVLPRMRGITSSLYIIVTTLFGIGIGPFVVGMISDANGGNLAGAILSINWVAPAIVAMLIALVLCVQRDEERQDGDRIAALGKGHGRARVRPQERQLRCTEILQKASLEKITAAETDFFKLECK